jgi:hypothetical protein
VGEDGSSMMNFAGGVELGGGGRNKKKKTTTLVLRLK